MKKRITSLILVAVFLLSFAPLKARADSTITVSLRIEGISSCLFYGDVTVNKAGASPITVQDVLEQADADNPGLSISITDSLYGPYLYSVNGESESTFQNEYPLSGYYDGWLCQINGVDIATGISVDTPSDGDSIVAYFGDPYGAGGMQYPEAAISYSGSDTVITFSSTVFDWITSSYVTTPIVDATVTLDNSNVYQTDANGQISAPLLIGVHPIAIEKYSTTAIVGGKALPVVLRYAPDHYITSNNPYFHSSDPSPQIIPAAGGGSFDISKNLNNAAGFLTDSITTPSVSDVGGDWTVLALSKSGLDIDKAFFDSYYDNACNILNEKNGILSDRKYTEYSRAVIGLTSAGYDARHISGYDLTSRLSDFDAVTRQGINGAIFALLALDCADYPVPDNAVRDKYIDFILERQLSDGGFSLSDKASDPDVTSFALQALAKYKSRADVSPIIDEAVSCLSKMQNEDGGFSSFGSPNAESCAQVIIAMCELGIPVGDPRFTKNGKSVLDALISYQTQDGGFSHLKDGKSDFMATEQGLLALCAANLLKSGDKLYSFVLPPFYDIIRHENREIIEKLYSLDIVNGMGDGSFSPDTTMTRAQFAAIICRALSLEKGDPAAFLDVRENAWYFEYVNSAYSSGIINGRTAESFDPEGIITDIEAQIMLSRAEKYMENSSASSEPSWIYSDVTITRCDMAQMIYALCEKAGKI